MTVTKSALFCSRTRQVIKHERIGKDIFLLHTFRFTVSLQEISNFICAQVKWVVKEIDSLRIVLDIYIEWNTKILIEIDLDQGTYNAFSKKYVGIDLSVMNVFIFRYTV